MLPERRGLGCGPGETSSASQKRFVEFNDSPSDPKCTVAHSSFCVYQLAF